MRNIHFFIFAGTLRQDFFAAFVRIDETIKTVERYTEFVKVKSLFQQSY